MMSHHPANIATAATTTRRSAAIIGQKGRSLDTEIVDRPKPSNAVVGNATTNASAMSSLRLSFAFITLTPRMSREQTASPFPSRATEGSALHSLVRPSEHGFGLQG